MSNKEQNTSTNLYSQYLSTGSVLLWHLSAISNGGAAGSLRIFHSSHTIVRSSTSDGRRHQHSSLHARLCNYEKAFEIFFRQ